jgi:Homing endonuclease associated repeat
MATLTRDEKVAEARRLRAGGLKAREIAERVKAPESTVRNWYLGGTCRCGAPLDGGDGVNSSKVCSSCAHEDSVLWPKDRILQKLREWVRSYGEPPTAYDWSPGLARAQAPRIVARVEERWEAGDWPSTNTVQEAFGSWNTAIAAAGFVPLKPGGSRHLRGCVL